MKRKNKPQKGKIEKKNSTLSWNEFLQISEIYEIREYNKNFNNHYDIIKIKIIILLIKKN